MNYRRVQGRCVSLVEAASNVIVGYLVALAAQQAIFPLFGIDTSFAQDAGVAAAFTLVSMLRSYVLRRFFERVATGRGLGRSLPVGRTWRIVEEP